MMSPRARDVIRGRVTTAKAKSLSVFSAFNVTWDKTFTKQFLCRLTF